ERLVPRLERDLERLLVELRELRSAVRDEDVQTAELLLHLGEEPSHVVDAGEIRLHEKAIASVLADALERVLRGGFVGVVVNRDPRAALGQLQRDAPPD